LGDLRDGERMRATLPEKLERGRVVKGEQAGDPSWGPYGKFFVRGPFGDMLSIIASGADADDVATQGWEHVSISLARRTPNWDEMCFVKDLFWDDTETVIQFHPPKFEYVNNHKYCLHLWRPTDGHVRLPPSILVGVKSPGILTGEEARVVRALTNGF